VQPCTCFCPGDGGSIDSRAVRCLKSGNETLFRAAYLQADWSRDQACPSPRETKHGPHAMARRLLHGFTTSPRRERERAGKEVGSWTGLLYKCDRRPKAGPHDLSTCTRSDISNNIRELICQSWSISCSSLVAILNLPALRCCWLGASPHREPPGVAKREPPLVSYTAGESPQITLSLSSLQSLALLLLFSTVRVRFFTFIDVGRSFAVTSSRSFWFFSSRHFRFKMRFSRVAALLALTIGAVAQTPVPYVLRILSHATILRLFMTNVGFVVMTFRTLFSWSLRLPCPRILSTMPLLHRLPLPQKWPLLSLPATHLRGTKLYPLM
jgi:hypothetical protein